MSFFSNFWAIDVKVEVIECKSYIRKWAAAPFSSRHPAACLSIFAAGLGITLDVVARWLLLRQKHWYQWDWLQLHHQKLLARLRGDVAGVALWAAVLLVRTAHSLQIMCRRLAITCKVKANLSCHCSRLSSAHSGCSRFAVGSSPSCLWRADSRWCVQDTYSNYRTARSRGEPEC